MGKTRKQKKKVTDNKDMQVASGKPEHELPLTRVEVRNMILEAKLDVARGKITLLIALFALLGLVTPLVLTGWNTVRTERATSRMEDEMRRLAEEYYRSADIVVTLNDKPLQGQTLSIYSTKHDSSFPAVQPDRYYQPIRIENIGDLSAGYTEMELHLQDRLDAIGKLYFCRDSQNRGYDLLMPPERPGYQTSYKVFKELASYNSFRAHSYREFSFLYEENASATSSASISAKLVIKCNLPEDIEIPFTMRFVPYKEE